MRVSFVDASATKDHAFRGIGTYAKALRAGMEQELKTKKYPIELSSPLQKGGVDVLHYPHFDFFFRTLFPPKNIPFIVTVHDVIPRIFPKEYKPGIKGLFRFWQQRRTLQKAKAIITDSICSKKDIIKHLGISSNRVHVVYLAANENLQPQSKNVQSTVLKSFGINKPYFLYVGDMNYNKNLPSMIKAFQQSGVKADLVLVGRNLRNYQVPEGKMLHEAIKASGNRVHVLTNVPSDPPEILSALFSGAIAYVQPSLYEGFGLSVLDAFRCECPVISSNASSLPEVCGTAASFFNPSNIQEMSLAFRKAYAWTPEQRRRRISAGKLQESQFSWAKTAKQTLMVYLEVMLEVMIEIKEKNLHV